MDEEFLQTLCGNHKIYNLIFDWLKNIDYTSRISEQSCIFVSGFPCTGKTYSLNKICKHANCHIINIDNNNCYNSSQLKDMIFKAATSSLVQIFTDASNNKVIIIDNFDAIFAGDKTINTTLLKILTDKKLKNIPIICITNNEIQKKLGDIKKACKIYDLCIPTKEEVIYFLKPRNLTIKTINLLYDNSNGNLDKLLQDIEQDDIVYKHEKDKNCDINILYEYDFDRECVRQLILTDTWLIPLRFHENIILELANRKMPLCKRREYYKTFINVLCLYDLYMYKNNIDTAVELFTYNVYFLSILKYKKLNVSNINNFTKILSYLSLQKKNIKTSYNSKFPLYQISNYHINLCNRKFIYF